jgi:membrane-associated phospholipid phosphatase
MSASARREMRDAALLAHSHEAHMTDFSMPARHSSSTFAFVGLNALPLPRSSDHP